VALPVVHGLEPVDIDEGHDEPPVRSARPVDLVGECQATHLSPIGTGQLVEMGRAQFGLEPVALARGLLSIGGGSDAILCRSRPIGGGLSADFLELTHQRRLALR
jgi:hypothetical protein